MKFSIGDKVFINRDRWMNEFDGWIGTIVSSKYRDYDGYGYMVMVDGAIRETSEMIVEGWEDEIFHDGLEFMDGQDWHFSTWVLENDMNFVRVKNTSLARKLYSNYKVIDKDWIELYV